MDSFSAILKTANEGLDRIIDERDAAIAQVALLRQACIEARQWILRNDDLENDSADLERLLGEPVVFNRKLGENWCTMYVANENVEDTEALKRWIVEKTKKFYEILKPRLDELMTQRKKRGTGG